MNAPRARRLPVSSPAPRRAHRSADVHAATLGVTVEVYGATLKNLPGDLAGTVPARF